MTHVPYCQKVLRSYLYSMLMQNLFSSSRKLEDMCCCLNVDLDIIRMIQKTCYFKERPHVLKAGNLHLAWEYAHSPDTFHCFLNMLRLTPQAFQVILSLIEDDPIFQSQSHQPQALVETQLAVALYQMGCYRNGASVQDIA